MEKLDKIDVELFNLYITNLKWTGDFTKFLASKVKEYGDKVYNVRFDKMLQNALDEYNAKNPCEVEKWSNYKPYISVHSFECKKIEIKLYGLKRSVNAGEDSYGNTQWRSFPSGYEDIKILYHWTNYHEIYSWCSQEARDENKVFDSKDTSPEYFFFDSNNNVRIHSENLEKLLLDSSSELLEKAKNLSDLLVDDKDGSNTIEKDIEESRRLQKLADSFYHSVNSTERAFFDIKTYATWQ